MAAAKNKRNKQNDRSPAAQRRAKIEEARRAERARDRRNRLLTIIASVVVLTATVVGGALLVASSDDDDPSEAGGGETTVDEGGDLAEGASPIEGVTSWTGLSQEHVENNVEYPQVPPVGGAHSSVWMNCNADVYDEEIPDENAVHALEHGSVWVTYNESATEADIETLSERVSATPYSLMSPEPDQTSPVMLTAWGHQLALDSADDERVAEFFQTYVQGEQTPEPGAACTGGKDQ